MTANLLIEIGDANVDKGYQVVKFNGEMDKAGLAEVKDELLSCAKTLESQTLLFDFAHMKFINSEGIGFLIEIHGLLDEAKKTMAILSPNSHVSDVFDAVGLKQIISVHVNLTDFLSH